MPEQDDQDEFRALKILQFQSRAVLVRHRLTHVDSEHMIQRNEFYVLKQEKDIMERRSESTSTAAMEVFESIQNRVDQCVELNLEMWETLNNIDQAATQAWRALGRILENGQQLTLNLGDVEGEEEAAAGGDEENPAEVLVVEGEGKEGEEKEDGEHHPPSPTKKAGRESMVDNKMSSIVQKMVDLHFEKIQLENQAVKSNNDAMSLDALKAFDEKIVATNKMVEDLMVQNTALKEQLSEKADAESVQKALRASRQVRRPTHPDPRPERAH
jgi:hypothetical protein